MCRVEGIRCPSKLSFALRAKSIYFFAAHLLYLFVGSAAAGDSPASSWSGLVPVMQVSSVTADGFAELRAFLGHLSPPEPLEAMYKEARGKAAEVCPLGFVWCM